MLGTVGHRNRMDGSVMGDTVNTASRIEMLTKTYQTPILVTGSSIAKLPTDHDFQLRLIDRVIVTGKSKPVEIWQVLNSLDASFTTEINQLSRQFEEARTAYTEGDIVKAKKLFETCEEHAPHDTIYQIYISRCIQLIKEGLPPGWNGVFTFTRK